MSPASLPYKAAVATSQWASRAALLLACAALLAWASNLGTAAIVLAGALALTLHGRRDGGLYAPPLVPTFLAALLLNALYAWLVTHGSFDWTAPEVHGESYDALAAAMLRGSAEVAPASIRGEAWHVNGHTFMYFGPFPALLRELPDLLVPSLRGHLSRPSVQLASALSLAATSALARLALAGNEKLAPAQRDRAYFTALLALGVASPMPIVGSIAYQYHEAIAWGLAPALWALYLALRLLDSTSWRGLGWLSTCAAAALLSRLTFGGAAYGLLGLVVLIRLARAQDRRASLRQAVPRLLPAIAGIALQLWYDAARFGSMFTVADFRAYENSKPVALGPSSPLRIPSAVWAYLIPHADNFRAHFPFFFFADRGPLQESLFEHRTTPTFPLPVSAPWAVLALGFAGWALWRARRWDLAGLALPLLGQVLLVMGYYFLGYRFVAEFLPLMALALWVNLRYARRTSLLRGLVVAGALVTLLGSLHFQSIWWGYPGPFREQLRQSFGRVDATLGLK